MTTRLKNLRLTEISFVDKGANPGAHVVIVKRRERMEKAMTLDECLAGLSEEQRAVIMSALEAAKAAPMKADAPADEPKKEDPVEMAKRKDLPEDVRKALEEAAKDRADIAKLKADARKRDYIEKARGIGEQPQLPIEKFAALLSEADERLSSDNAEALRKHFVSVAELVRKGDAFRALGTSGADCGGGAFDEIKALAEDLVKSDPKITIQKAMLLVTERHPELVKRHREGA